jgi:predicted phosphoadenosine phosphosulfate sulfurtransferase
MATQQNRRHQFCLPRNNPNYRRRLARYISYYHCSRTHLLLERCPDDPTRTGRRRSGPSRSRRLAARIIATNDAQRDLTFSA